MTYVDLSTTDLAKVRFAHSPVWESAALAWELAAGGSVSVHARGLRATMDARSSALLDLLAPLTRLPGWFPDTMAPTPVRGLTAEESFASIVETDLGVAEQDLSTLRRAGAGGAWASLSPREFQRRVSVVLEQLWSSLLRPRWERLDAIVAADISRREHDLGAAGLEGMLERLHPGVGLSGTSVQLPVGGSECRHGGEGTGMLLVPSVIRWSRVSLSALPGEPIVVSYPALGPATLWDPVAEPGRALDNLIGRTRASILAAVAEPRTTTSLSHQLRLSLATVSTHLTTLRTSGLVSRSRQGRSVLYGRTDLGTHLLTSSGHHLDPDVGVGVAQ